MNTGTNARIPVLIILATASALLATRPLAAQPLADDDGTVLTYGFNLLPDTYGTLNARLDLGVRWTDWLSSGVAAYTDNYVRPMESDADISTLESSGSSLELTALRIDQDLLWRLIRKRLDFVELSAGLVGAYSVTEQSRYGYDPSGSAPVFYIEDSRRSILRPLQSYSLGLRLGPARLTGAFESTVYWSAETVASSRFTSEMAEAPTPISLEYKGGDTKVSGELELDLRAVVVLGGVQFYRHVMTAGTASTTSQSDSWSYRGAVVLSFLKLAGGCPLVGASWVVKDEYFVAGDENLASTALRLELGLRY